MPLLRVLIVFLLLALPLTVNAKPANEEEFVKVTGLVSIPDGSYVEGSSRYGGTQPDYKIEYRHPEIQRLVNYARRVEREEKDFWRKVNRLTKYVDKRHLPHWRYDAPGHTGINKKYLEMGADVSLGEYSACRSGVCRENALLLHIALKEAGVPNFHGYAQVRVTGDFENTFVVEDHAFVVAERDGKRWVLDSYNEAFNGYLLEDLMSERGVTPESESAPVAKKVDYFRRIQKMNDFPAIWLPKSAGPPQVMPLSPAASLPVPKKCADFFRLLPEANGR